MNNIRTRTLTAVILIGICVLITACGKDSRALLWYQSALSSATVSDGAHTWRLTPTADGYTAEIVSPPEASGVTFHLTDASATVSVHGIEIPVSDAMTAGARRLIGLFSLDEARVSEVRPDKGAKTTRARIRTDGGEITVVFGEDGLPLSFETADGAVSVESCALRTE